MRQSRVGGRRPALALFPLFPLLSLAAAGAAVPARARAQTVAAPTPTLFSSPAVAPAVAPVSAPPGKRLLTLGDLYREHEAAEPRLSPDGGSIVYTVSTIDSTRDEAVPSLYLSGWSGDTGRRVTWSKTGEHTPRWRPDGQAIAFLSSRSDEHEVDQLWILPRGGGEAYPLTSFRGGVTDYAWSPDGRTVAVIAADPDPDSSSDSTARHPPATPRPIVITRFQFRKDNVGWLTDRRDRLYVVDVVTHGSTLLTPGPTDAALPSWSPDGRQIAYVRKTGMDGDRTMNYDVYTVEPRAGAAPHQVTTFEGDDNDPDWTPGPPAWSPDGRWIVYVRGGLQRMLYYAAQHLAIVPAAGGPERLLTPDLDRNAVQPRWSPDGRSVYFLLEDDRAVHLARVAVAVAGDTATGGPVEPVVADRQVVASFDVGRDGRLVYTASTPSTPPEVFATESPGHGRQVSQANRWLDSVALATTHEVSVRSADGTMVNGFVVVPPGAVVGQRYPAILRNHGGPVWQWGDEFYFDWQLMAAHGYVVMGANPRGSSGRGQKYTSAIFAAWGEKDFQDVLALVDHTVADGLADSARLGVGGWSYGAILTDEVIARTPRFKAATSGAGTGNALAGYGTDEYVREYEAELGTPWQRPEVWLRVSYPFLHSDRIVTPTLFLGGELDANVPLLNSQQLYQALRSLGRPTQLVVYPGEYHSFTKASHIADRLARYLAWYDRYLTSKPSAANAATGAP